MKLSRISKCLTLPSSVIGNAKVIILVVIVAGLGGWFFMQNTNNENEIMPENLEGITTAAYGAWESPVTAASIFESSDNISTLTVENNELYFIERILRPLAEALLSMK